MCISYHFRITNDFIIIILASLAISGCGVPKVNMHKEVEANKQAVIQVEEREQARGQLTIAQVDGKETVGLLSRLFNGGNYAGEVSVLSGKHRIIARIVHFNSYAWGYLWLVADSGETYIVKARTEGYHTKMWLENARNGQKVGGVVGSKDEPK